MRPPLYPATPPKGASRLERMEFLRRNYFYGMALVMPIFVSGLIAFTPVVFVCVAVWLLQLCGLLVLQSQIRAERGGSEH